MSEFKRINARGKSTRYMMRDDMGRFRLVSDMNVPARVRTALADLEIGSIYSDTPSQTVPVIVQPSRACIFCNSTGQCQKYVFGQIVYLCGEDYQNKTTGEIGQRVKEMQHAKGQEERES